jgi:uncharacterized oxidoreductase
MQMQGNTIFITGGTSGIGRGLAEAFHHRGNQVIIAGRREQRLREVSERHPGMAWFVLDVTRPDAVLDVARRVIAQFPEVNCVVNNAGVQKQISFRTEEVLDDARLEDEIATNLLGPIRVTAAFLPHLLNSEGKSPPRATPARSGAPTLLNVSSGLAFVPMARFAVYCATKAAIHSWTMSLRHQVQSLGVKVIEIVPPWVATELGGPRKPAATADARGPMALDAFIAEVMRELEADVDEVIVAEANRLVAATSPETVKKVFSFMNG